MPSTPKSLRSRRRWRTPTRSRTSKTCGGVSAVRDGLAGRPQADDAGDGLGVFGIVFCNSFKCFHRQNDNSAAFNANPVVLFPKTQLAISAFPCHANKIAEI